MAKPFFSGNYGSALARVDTRPIIEAGRAQGQMYANLGKQIGGMIQQYGLNKEKRAELTGEIEAMLPQYMDSFTGTGNEVDDKKNFQRLEKFSKGDMSMADLKGLAGELAMKDKVQSKQLVRDLSTAQLQSVEFLNQQRKESASNMDNAFNALDRTRDEIKSLVDNGTLQPGDLTLGASRLLNNPSLLKSRNVEALKYFASDPAKDAESKLKLSNLERGQKVQRGLDDSLGGAGNVGAMQGESMKETLAGQKASRERTQSLTDATRLQMELLERPAVNSIPQNQAIDKQINNVSSKIKSLRSKKSFTKNDDDEFFSLDSLIDFDPITGVATISKDASKRDAVELDSLKKLVEEEYLLRMQEIVPHELKDGTTINAPRGDIIRLMQEEDEERKYIEAQKIPDQRSGFMSGMNMDYSNIDPSIAELMGGNQR
jgi:hypothetical protein